MHFDLKKGFLGKTSPPSEELGEALEAILETDRSKLFQLPESITRVSTHTVIEARIDEQLA